MSAAAFIISCLVTCVFCKESLAEGLPPSYWKSLKEEPPSSDATLQFFFFVIASKFFYKSQTSLQPQEKPRNCIKQTQLPNLKKLSKLVWEPWQHQKIDFCCFTAIVIELNPIQ